MTRETIIETIAISSCKGGVGKSTVAALLAQELARRGAQVGLMDADIYGPSIPTLFNLQHDKIHINEFKQFVPITKSNLKIMSFGFLLGDAPAVMRGPIVTRYIQQILLNTAWGNLDYLLIDMPPGTGDVQLTITQSVQLSGAVIVTTPQTLSLIDVARGILMFEKVKVPILGIIENMSNFICDNCAKKHYIFGKQGAGILKERFGVKILAELPLSDIFGRTIDERISNPDIAQAADRVITAMDEISVDDMKVPKIQYDDKNVTLTYNNGQQLIVSNRDLRASCRCALCVNELTGEKTLKEESIGADIAAKEITPLGNYAIGIAWNDGHSSGIYPYETIQEIAQKGDRPIFS